MLTMYELKNRSTCRFFYKIPYFIKNLFLLFVLACIMVPIYFVHFRHESITNIYRLVAGLNSRTFNYLQDEAKAKLNVKKDIKKQEVNSMTSR